MENFFNFRRKNQIFYIETFSMEFWICRSTTTFISLSTYSTLNLDNEYFSPFIASGKTLLGECFVTLDIRWHSRQSDMYLSGPPIISTFRERHQKISFHTNNYTLTKIKLWERQITDYTNFMWKQRSWKRMNFHFFPATYVYV